MQTSTTISTTILTSLKELGLLGHLNYVSMLILQYKTRVKLIKHLLHTSVDVQWTEVCTMALNNLMLAAALHVRLELYCPGVPV